MNNYKEKQAELKKLLIETFKKKITNEEGIKELTDHFKIEGLYHYSFYNRMMIMAQGGTVANSFNRWKELHRHVLKGQHSNIDILCPIFKTKADAETKEEKDKKYLSFFMLRPVFDISQTTGEPLKYIHNSTEETSINIKQLEEKLKEKFNFTVKYFSGGDARGYVKADAENKIIYINEFNNDTDKIKVIVHEIAHKLLKHDSKTNKLTTSSMEVEADSTALIVSKYLDLDIEINQQYIQSWNKGGEHNINKILSTSEKIIKNLFLNEGGK